jgi:hypothetical protein
MVRFLCAITACLLLSVGAANSATLYLDRTGWSNAVSGVQNIDFEGIAPGGGSTDFSTSTGLTLDGVQFVGTLVANTQIGSFTSNHLTVFDPAADPSRYDWGSGAVLGGPYSGIDFSGEPVGYHGSFTITLPAGTYAFGTDLMVSNSNGDHLGGMTVTLANGDSVDIAETDRPLRDFVGYISSAPIASLTVSIDDPTAFPPEFRYGLLDNFAFSTVAPAQVPEPSSLAITILGAMVIAFIKRRRSSASVVPANSGQDFRD